METLYELWDTETSNLVGTYPTERAALAIVRSAVRAHGPDAFATIALGREDERGNMIPVATGAELVRLAHPDERPQDRAGLLRSNLRRAGARVSFRRSRRAPRQPTQP